MKTIFRVFLLLSVIYFQNIECYNKTLQLSNARECIELHLEKDKHYYTDVVIPISDLGFNQPEKDEILRMKTFLLGKDFYIEMMQNSNKPVYYNEQVRFYHTVIGGWEGLKSKISISGLDGPGVTCGITDTNDLLHNFYLTELEMVVKKGELFKVSESLM